MSVHFGLKIGESFAEIRAFRVTGRAGSAEAGAGKSQLKKKSLDKPLFQSRWFLPKRPLAEGIKDALQAADAAGALSGGGEIRIVSTRHERALARRQVQSPAFLVTSGFETRLALSERDLAGLEPERTFGISERIDAAGKIISPLKIEELEFIAAKLELLKTKHIAIGFLHARKNPAHEEQAASYLRERGFNVVTSHSFTGRTPSRSDEAFAWRAAIECASTAALAEEDRTAIDSALTEALGSSRPEWKVHLLGEAGATDLAHYSPVATRGGLESSLKNLLSAELADDDATLCLHFGIESFHLIHLAEGRVHERMLAIQPTQLIGIGAWGTPVYEGETRGYEPGPMLFGKSHQLSFIDILFARDRLEEVEGFTPLVSDKARTRILDTVFTLGKALSSETGRRVDSSEIAADLELVGVDRISFEISRVGSKSTVLLSGAFASSLLPLLKRRRPDLEFRLLADWAWTEAEACLKSGTGEA